MHNLSQFRSLTLDSAEQNKVARLTFTHSGKGIILLSMNGTHQCWRWKNTDINVEGKVTTEYNPYIWKSEAGLMMINDITNVQTEEASHCFALSNSDSYLISTSGGPLTLFNVVTWQAVMDVMRPPPLVTCVAFNPQDNNLVTVGMNDSSIQMYDFRVQEFKVKAVGHFRKITGLAFSLELNILVSAAADAEIIVWSLDTWVRQRSTYLQIPNARVRARLSDTEVQFHTDQKHFLAIHETQLALYEASKLIRIKQWTRAAHLSVLVSATFSCDSQLVYACFRDGLLGVFSTSTFELQCVIHPIAYIPESLRCRIYPTAIASNPNAVNQFAVGLSDGRVILLEPLETESEWGRVERG